MAESHYASLVLVKDKVAAVALESDVSSQTKVRELSSQSNPPQSIQNLSLIYQQKFPLKNLRFDFRNELGADLGSERADCTIRHIVHQLVESSQSDKDTPTVAFTGG